MKKTPVTLVANREVTSLNHCFFQTEQRPGTTVLVTHEPGSAIFQREKKDFTVHEDHEFYEVLSKLPLTQALLKKILDEVLKKHEVTLEFGESRIPLQ